jgi:hypothetical protein
MSTTWFSLLRSIHLSVLTDQSVDVIASRPAGAAGQQGELEPLAVAMSQKTDRLGMGGSRA